MHRDATEHFRQRVQRADRFEEWATDSEGRLHGGDAWLTGKPGVCLTTLGPGALNLTTGAAYVQLGAMPKVMITGQKAVLSSRQAQFQIVDVVSVMRPPDEALPPARTPAYRRA